MYICGEYTCKPPLNRLYPFFVVQKQQPAYFVLEHRYYGTSQPFNDWSTDNLRYLTADQALADLAGFIDFQNANMNKQYPGTTRKWVVVGGSYPGALAAWF